MLNKDYYYNAAHLEFENDKIFSKSWVFACLVQEVKDNNEFVTLDIAGNPIVIQNFKGEIRAFQNICTHRFNKIQVDNFGKRPLTCGYHCWTFDKEGYPLFIPKKALFTEFADDDIIQGHFCLRKYQLEIVGIFVFISIAENTIELREYLGVYYDILEEISKHMGKRIHFGELIHRANWKILVENVLECYHCSTVHKDSLAGNLGIGKLPITDIEASNSHSSCHFPKTLNDFDVKKKKILAFLDTRTFKHQSFYHIYIFPNLVISSTEGASFYVGQISPIAAEETGLKIRFFEPNLNYDNVSTIIREALAEESIKLGYKILEEDKNILENIQKGIKQSASPGIINNEEIRIQYFFDKYLKIINN